MPAYSRRSYSRKPRGYRRGRRLQTRPYNVGIRNRYGRRAVIGAAKFGAGLIGPVGQHMYSTISRKRVSTPVNSQVTPRGVSSDWDYSREKRPRDLEYMSQDEINHYSAYGFNKMQRLANRVRKFHQPGVVPSLSSGRRRPLINFRMKDVMDMIAPTVHFKTQRNMTHIASTCPDQGIGYDYVLTVDDVKNMMVKCSDVNPQYNAGSLDSTDDFTFVFNGGNYKYKVSNSCNIDAYVDILVITAKRPTNWSVDDAWSQDMIHDNTITDTSGVYTQTSEERRLDLGNRPGKSGVKFNSNWRKRYVGRRVLKPGEEFTYNHKLMPWKWNVKTWNEHLTSSGASAADLPDYFEKTQAIMFIVHGQNVHDSADGDCAPGSAQINVNVSETFSWRAVPGTKKDQYISQNALPTISAAAQRIFQDDGDLQTGTVNA